MGHIIAALLFFMTYAPASGQQTTISTVISLPAEHTRTASHSETDSLLTEGTRVSLQNPQAAIPIVQRSVDLSLGTHNYGNAFQGYLSLGAIYTSTGNYLLADTMFRKALSLSFKTPNPLVNMCRALNNLGNIYVYQCNYRQAALHYFKAATLANRETEHNATASDQLVRIYNNLGAVLLQLDEHRKAIYYLDKAIQRCDRYDHPVRMSSILVNKAAVYDKMGMTDTAWEYAHRALALSRKYHKIHEEFAAQVTLATILLNRGQPASAIPYLDAAFRIRGNIFPYYRADALYSMGRAYLMLRDYDRAAHFFEQGQHLATSTNLISYSLLIHKQQSMLYLQRGNYRQSLLHLQAAYLLNDSLLNKDKTEAVNLLEVKYRTAEKDKEIVQKQLQIKNQERHLERKNRWIYTTTGSALVLTILLAALYKNYQHKQRLQAHRIHILQQEQELLRREQEINTLKAIMLGEEQERTRISQDLHDGVGSTLAAVKMNFTAIRNDYPLLAEESKFLEAMNRLDDMYHELRQAAHNLTPEFLLQHGLPDAVSLYCEQIQKGKGMMLTFQSYGSFHELSSDFSLTVYRIIQELVHNIVKHAQATHALLQLYHHDHLLSVNIEDNGIGFRPGDAKGIGLSNLQRRVKSLHGRMQVESSEKGSGFFLEFDLDENQYQPQSVKPEKTITDAH